MSEAAIDAGAAAPANEAALPAAGSEAAPQTPTPVTIVEEKKPSIDDDLVAVWEKNHPPKDGKSGRFVPKVAAKAADAANTDTAAAPAEKPAEAQAQPDPTDSAGKPEEGKVEPVAKAPAIEPPHSWPAEHKAKWASVPPELQPVIARRETEAHQAITRAGQTIQQLESKAKSFEPLDQLISLHKDEFTRRGVQPVQAIAHLLAAQVALDKNPLGGLVQIGRGYGIDLAPLLQAAGIQQPQQIEQRPDPYVAQLEARIKAQDERIETFTSKLTEKERAAQEAELSQANVVISDFSKDKPYFEEVRPLMAFFLAGDPERGIPSQAKNLDEAYDMAVNAKPAVRTRIQEDQRKADEAKRTAEAQAKAAEARKASSVNVRSGPAQSPTRTMDDDLHDMAQRLYQK